MVHIKSRIYNIKSKIFKLNSVKYTSGTEMKCVLKKKRSNFLDTLYQHR